jgi:hypothetical protein
MNRITRLLAIAGLGLGTAVAIGAGPAQAAGTSTTLSATSGASAQAQNGWDDEDVVGYFRTAGNCERAGLIGENRDRWDDFDCTLVRSGSYRGTFVLTVSDDDWNGGWNNHNWYSGWDNSWHGGDWDNNWHGGSWGNWHGGGNWHHGGWNR